MRVAIAALLGCVLLFAVAQAADPVSADRAQTAAAALIADVAAQTRANPAAPGAFPAWVSPSARPGAPVLVHSYPDLEPSYYIVPVASERGPAASIVTIDARTGEWQAFAELAGETGYPAVTAETAAGIAGEALDGAVSPADLRAVSMPNKSLYWYAKVGSRDVFVNLSDRGDVRTALDASLMTPLDPAPAGPLPQEHASGAPQPSRYPSSYDIVSVPYHVQLTSYTCGPASLEMVFDYWGPDINQTDVAHVANAQPAYGVYTTDLRRAAHFSSSSVAIQDPNQHGYDERSTGYAAAENQWSYGGASDPDYPDRYNDLKNLISSNFPIILLTWYDGTHSSGHFRVVKGYNDATNVFIVHDPWYTPPYQGPNVQFNQTFLVDNLWDNYYRWGLFTAPWMVLIQVNSPVPRGRQFPVGAFVGYPGPHPFEGDYPAGGSITGIGLSPGFELAPGEPVTKALEAIGATGSGDQEVWQVIAPCPPEPGLIHVGASGMVMGSSYSYSMYTDGIGGEKTQEIAISPNPNMLAVAPDGSGEYPTIQDAIDCAPCDGDVVELLPGTYTGGRNRDLDFGGRNLTVRGTAGRVTTVIDCEDAGRGFVFHSGEDSTSVVEGLTILNGAAVEGGPQGGGILCLEAASPRIQSVALEQCSAPQFGGGMAWINSSPILEEVRFEENTAGVAGGGAFCYGDTLGRFQDVEFVGNSAVWGGGAYLEHSSPAIDGALFSSNSADQGAALYAESGPAPEISGSTFVMNQSLPGQYAIQILNASPDIWDTIIAGTIGGAGVGCTGLGIPWFTYCCSYGNAGGDSLCGNHSENLFVDPLFCDAPAQDFTLHDDSPCLPGNNSWGRLIGKYAEGGCGYGTGIAESEPAADTVPALVLHAPSGNPLSGAVALVYDLPDREDALTVAVYNLRGELVRTLCDGRASGGRGRVVWDGADGLGREVASGVYFVRAAYGPETASEKVVVVR